MPGEGLYHWITHLLSELVFLQVFNKFKQNIDDIEDFIEENIDLEVKKFFLKKILPQYTAQLAKISQEFGPVGQKTVQEFFMTHYNSKILIDHRLYVTIGCELGEKRKTKVYELTDDEIPVKMRDFNGTKKCNCHFLLKGEQTVSRQFWKLTVQDRRHNHKIGVHPHGHAQAAQLTNDELNMPKNILDSLCRKHTDCAVRYNMPLLEAIGMTLTDKLTKLKDKWHKRPDFIEYLFDTWLILAPKFVRIWTGKILHFGSETTNRVEAQHSVLKAYLLHHAVSEIKKTLESSRMIEKYNASSNLEDIRKIQQKEINCTGSTYKLLLERHSSHLVDQVSVLGQDPVAVRALEGEVEEEVVLGKRVRDYQLIHLLQIHPMYFFYF
ncbi:hypothetical protein M9H77_34026 [Catharanthus roseus]|uniref:Uncharacterized protein n=1 Tax=Catharanthus roseus TaxID=4058 RepID=A0ACB9ZJZ6_CATRO|nr:hypothetical protein M9H77_34026 [Catharanthus roseus]